MTHNSCRIELVKIELSKAYLITCMFYENVLTFMNSRGKKLGTILTKNISFYFAMGSKL